jgi:phosphoribosylanthranilate isomerase
MPLPPVPQQTSTPGASLWIKICGMTTAEGVAAAVGERVDAVGFVFYPPSRRYVRPADAARLARDIPEGILKVAVFLHPRQAEVDAVLGEFQPDILQSDLEDLSMLRLPSGLAVLPVLRSGAAMPATLPPRVLFEGPVSGTGVPTDWKEAGSLVRRTQVVLAGGLHPGNVALAVQGVRPFGVDVSSGVEQAPGIKDPARIHEFVAAARRQNRMQEFPQ